MPLSRAGFLGLAFVLPLLAATAQTPGAGRVTPNLIENIERPLRYRPDHGDFVIENGAEYFNRPLYGGNTAFRVDGGDKPEFVLYLPGRGGNLRLGVKSPGGAKWLHSAARVTTRYRPGELLYEISDPLLGEKGLLRLTAIACDQTEGLIVRAEGAGVGPGVELIWAFGGVNGQRGTRDGDIGTERVPISEYFQLRPEFCRDNLFAAYPSGGFVLAAKAAVILGAVTGEVGTGDASHWQDAATLLASVGAISAAVTPETPRVAVGRVALVSAQPVFLGFQRMPGKTGEAADLSTYLEVKGEKPGVPEATVAEGKSGTPVKFTTETLPGVFAAVERHFEQLRSRVAVETPDPFIDAAVGALNVAADAVWDEPQGVIMHGAIAWRTKLLGWRGPYALDALGWHERARQNLTYWAGRQNTGPIPDRLPPADEKANLARNEAGLHSNGDMSNSHYDMNAVFIDGLFRHLRWTGDREFAKKMWPVIERHLAWERRLFRREFGPDGAKLPLYEAYAMIWASDDLEYGGGGTTHASAYNYFHNVEAARLALLLGVDATPYQREAQLIARGMREHLWLPERGAFGEYKDLLGLQRVHPSAAVWTFYHTLDAEMPTSQEAWQMTQQVESEIPHLPVRGPGVPVGLHTLASSSWMPYSWSINNVVMGEALHTALGFWQAGRQDEAWKMTKGSLLAAMFMGISPGNVGSMSYLDVYRRESQRDFGDGSGVTSRVLVEGLFGLRPNALVGELRVEPGFPAEWDHASLSHPDLAFRFKRTGETDSYVIEQKFAKPQNVKLRLVARRDRVTAVTVDGEPVRWLAVEDSVEVPRIEILTSANARHEIVVQWAGVAPHQAITVEAQPRFVPVAQGEMRWLAFSAPRSGSTPKEASTGPLGGVFDSVDLNASFNDQVTQIFAHEYRSPRSPFVSLALPKQGIGAWAGHLNATAEIDDSGLRAAAGKNGGRVVLPNGVPFTTASEPKAKNVVFTSQWDNFPREAVVPLAGKARQVYFLMAGSTNHMQSRFENGEVVVTYTDGSTTRLALENPTNWWPIDQDYFIDDYQFRPGTAALPMRVDLKSGRMRVLELATFKGRGGVVAGGAATVLDLPLDPQKELKSLTVRALANEVVVGLMAATLVR